MAGRPWLLLVSFPLVSLALVSLVLVSSSVGCSSYVPQDLDPYWPTQGWRAADPRDAHLDPDKLDDMVHSIERSGVAVDSVAVIRYGYLLLDEYFAGFAKGQKHNVYSCTKSVVSALIGIAMERGDVQGAEQKLLEVFSERTVDHLDASKEAITLEHLLTMSAGFDARDSYLYEWEGLVKMVESPDPAQYVLDLPMAREPGVQFEYTNGISHLLSAIVTKTTGLSALEYAQQHLFAPLGVTGVEWEADAQGRNWGYSKLHLSAHDMAKIGYLYLKTGQWDAEQVVPADWVEVSTARHIPATLVDGYGYQWWVGSSYYLALGYQGQFIFVVPEQELVVVLTGSSPETFDFSITLIDRFILPAVVGP